MITNRPGDNTRPSESPSTPPVDSITLDNLFSEYFGGLYWQAVLKAQNFVDFKKALLAWHHQQTTKTFKLFFDTFEKEIDKQEFAIDEAEWMGLIQAMRLAEQTAIQAREEQ